MFLSSLRRVLYRGPDGTSQWREVSELKLPKGGKTLSFHNTGLLVFIGCMGLFVYAQFQEDINPESKWGVYFRKITREPLKFLGADKTEEVPAPSHTSHIRYIYITGLLNTLIPMSTDDGNMM